MLVVLGLLADFEPDSMLVVVKLLAVVIKLAVVEEGLIAVEDFQIAVFVSTELKFASVVSVIVVVVTEHL